MVRSTALASAILGLFVNSVFAQEQKSPLTFKGCADICARADTVLTQPEQIFLRACNAKFFCPVLKSEQPLVWSPDKFFADTMSIFATQKK